MHAQRLTGIGAWEWDLRSGRATWSDQLCAILGVTPGTVTPSCEAYLKRVHPADREQLGRRVQRSRERGVGFEDEHRIVRPDGGVRVVHTIVDVELDACGDVVGLFGFVQDVTNDREAEQCKEELLRARFAEEAALTAERRLREVLDAVPQQVWMTDADGRILMVNERVCAYFGALVVGGSSIDIDERRERPVIDALASEALREAIHPDDYERAASAWRAAVRTRTSLSVELRLFSEPAGSFRWHLCRAEPQLGRDGRIERWIGTNTDLHAVREARAAVEEKARELEELTRHLVSANEELDRFAYVTSHDLRAPLRGISNLAHWIEEDLSETAGSETKEHLGLLRGRVTRLEKLIDGVLRYVRAGRPCEPLERVDVRRLLMELVDLLDPPADACIEIEGALPVLVTERNSLMQVFQNLIQNAVTHGRNEDGVRVRIGARRGEGSFTFYVSDDGPGIEERFQERIWEMFKTLRSNGAIEPTGVGLPLVRKIVEGRGGQVSVESVPGKGATFLFTWSEQPSRTRAQLQARTRTPPGSRSARATPPVGLTSARRSRR